MGVPDSGASYIIICSGRINVLAAKDVPNMIAAASQCAANLCAFITSNYTVNPLDFHPVSVLQHELMDNMFTLNKREAETKIAQLFTLCEELEDKY